MNGRRRSAIEDLAELTECDAFGVGALVPMGEVRPPAFQRSVEGVSADESPPKLVDHVLTLFVLDLGKECEEVGCDLLQVLCTSGVHVFPFIEPSALIVAATLIVLLEFSQRALIVSSDYSPWTTASHRLICRSLIEDPTLLSHRIHPPLSSYLTR